MKFGLRSDNRGGNRDFDTCDKENFQRESGTNLIWYLIFRPELILLASGRQGLHSTISTEQWTIMAVRMDSETRNNPTTQVSIIIDFM
jgi:hypothetical protein